MGGVVKLDKIVNRIEELEEVKKNMDKVASEKRKELASVEAEANEIREIINKNIFENTEEYKELQELKTTKKWLDIYNSKER